jgi:putative ABC transport system substrate-binding protein
MIERREFIAGLGSAAAWPVVARAQQPERMPVIGYLSGSSKANVENVASFLRGLADGGYIEGRNVAIEYRWAENRLERLPELAADLVQRQVAAIFTSGKAGPPAAKAATATVPIVFQMGEHPVKEGIVTRLDRRGGNITGFSNFTNRLFSKRVELLRDIAPRAEAFAFLVNPNNPNQIRKTCRLLLRRQVGGWKC